MTPKQVQGIVSRVCGIPYNYNERGDISIGKLLAESGYVAFRDKIGVVEICQHLEAHPQFIDSWASYSSDKQRCKTGWFFDDGRHLIWRYSSDGERACEQTFSGRAQACAEFIKRELDDIHAMLHPKPWWKFW
jgi:hypothetical protein